MKTAPQKNIRVLSLRMLGLALAGHMFASCSAFQTSTTQTLPTVPDQKPTSDQALIILDGTPSFSGVKLYAVKIYDNKTLVGKVGPKGKLAWLRDPGPMDLNMDGLIGMQLNVVSGKIYHCKVECSPNLVYAIAGPGIAYNNTAWGEREGLLSPDKKREDLLRSVGNDATGSTGLGLGMDAASKNIGSNKVIKPDGSVIRR